MKVLLCSAKPNVTSKHEQVLIKVYRGTQIEGNSPPRIRQPRSRVRITFEGSLLSRMTSSKGIQNSIERQLQGDTVCGSILGGTTNVTRFPVCGNGICEAGESTGSIGSVSGGEHTCTEDCVLSLNRCAYIFSAFHACQETIFLLLDD